MCSSLMICAFNRLYSSGKIPWKKLDGTGSLVFRQGAAEHVYGGDTLKGVTGKERGKSVAPESFKTQFKQRE